MHRIPKINRDKKNWGETRKILGKMRGKCVNRRKGRPEPPRGYQLYIILLDGRWIEQLSRMTL